MCVFCLLPSRKGSTRGLHESCTVPLPVLLCVMRTKQLSKFGILFFTVAGGCLL